MKRLKVVIFISCLLVIYESLASGTEVSLYTESGLLSQQDQLRVRIFADITDIADEGPLLSAGFVLNYSGGLANPVAEKNVVDWYFGIPTDLQTYLEPDTTREGEVVFLLGKLDKKYPSQGISGYRIFLGSILFDYSGSPPTPADLMIADGHPAPFADFVTTKGADLDAEISYTVAEFLSEESLQLQGVIRALQLLNGIVTDKPARIAPDDITKDGKIGIEEPIFLLRQIAH